MQTPYRSTQSSVLPEDDIQENCSAFIFKKYFYIHTKLNVDAAFTELHTNSYHLYTCSRFGNNQSYYYYQRHHYYF